MENVKVRCNICKILKDGFSIKHYNLKICQDCYPYFFTKRVDSTIDKFKMFDRQSDLLIAISGGKDSLSVTKALKELDYNLRALHINLNITDFSKKSQEIVQKFCLAEKIPLKIINLNDEINATLKELSRIAKKPVCAVCGMLRRYFMNREANESIIVTGHTLNDEVSFILKNLLFWNDELLLRIYPILEKREGLNKKAKPLCFITEEETIAYCKVLNIEYYDQTCPYKPEVYEIFKRTVENFNNKLPGSILGFYKGFLKRSMTLKSHLSNLSNIKPCQLCGYPTNSSICSICRIKEKLLQYKNG